MFALAPPLRRYLLFVYGCAAVILVFCFRAAPPFSTDLDFLLSLGLFCLFSFLSELGPVAYKRKGGLSQTVSTATFIAAVFVLPPFSLLLVIILSSALAELLGHKPWYKLLFNVANRVVCFGLLSLIIDALRLDPFAPPDSLAILTFVVLFLIYAVYQVVSMGMIVALQNRRSILAGWRESSKYFNEYDMALFPYGLILAWLWNADRWFFVIGLLPLLAMQRSFAVHARLMMEQAAMEQLTEQQRRVQAGTTLLLSSKDVHTQIDTLLRHLMEVFPVARGSVLIWGQGDEEHEVVSRGDGPPLPVTNWADNLRRISEARRLVQLKHDFATRFTEGRPIVLVPLVTPDEIVGCLVLVTEDLAALEGEGEQLIETFAAQAALAIYQARLIARLESSQVRVVQSERLAAIGTLAAGVAHEFNNLLAGISGVAQLGLLEEKQEEQIAALDTVVKASQQGGSITRGLLTFARHLEPKRELADIYVAIEPVMSMMQAEFRRANITVVSQIQPVSPLICDVGMLGQVVLNLVTNAIDAMHPNGGTLTVTLEEQDDEIRLAVSDTGCGIPEHVRDRIFEPFVSTKTPSDGKLHGGTGLGLAISYGIITDHGGQIEVESQAQVGTTMTIRLPVTPLPDSVSRLRPANGSEPLRIIVVDDEPMIAKSLHGLLTREGHLAQWFTEPLKALDAIDDEPVDVIFTDLAMPYMDGVTLLQQVRLRAPHATQIVVTGQVDPPLLERVRALGVHRVIEKPFSLDAIRAVVDEVRMLHVYV